MLVKISKRKIPKILEYLTDIRRVVYEARTKIESLSKQMYGETKYRSYYVDHAVFLFSLCLEDLRKEKMALEERLKKKRKLAQPRTT